jgi:toxin CcdB
MKQFAVYENKNPKSRKIIPYLLNVQADVLNELQTSVVVPLVPADAGQHKPISRLTPMFSLESHSYIMLTPQLAGISKRELGEPIADLSSARDEIIAAIDFLVTGF